MAPQTALNTLLALLVLGSLPPASRADAQAFQDEAEVAAVLAPVTVRDAKGRLVPNLPQRLFHLKVDGIEFPIRSFWQEGGLPLSITFILDTSGSMGTRRLTEARNAILYSSGQLRPDDEICLITFGAGEVKRRLPFGTDRTLVNRILGSLSGFGTTALYDVLTVTPKAMEGARNIRRAVLLFTDGVDTASQFTAADALKVLEELADPLYVFGIEPPPPSEGAAETYEALLTRFAEASGGRYIRVTNLAAMQGLASQLRRELTQRYIIAFEPSGLGISKLRTIDVTVDGKFSVSARKSYRGTLP